MLLYDQCVSLEIKQKAMEPTVTVKEMIDFAKECQITVLLRVLTNGHGGGNWWRLIQQEIAKLEE